MLIDVHAHFLHDRYARAPTGASGTPAGSAPASASASPSTSPPSSEAGAHVTHLFPLARRPPLRQRRAARAPARAPRRGSAATSPSTPTTPTSRSRRSARCLDAGMIGIKLAASRRADDPLLDPICRLAAERGVPILHHVWQHRRRDYPGQEASDARELGELAARHPRRAFILAHIGGGGDWLHSLPPSARSPNVYVDLSGSGVDGGMLEACLEAVGVGRLLWGCDLTIETGWAKLRYLEHLLSAADWSACAGGTRPASSRPAPSPPTDAHRRQRLSRRVSLPPRAGHLAGGGPRRDGSGRASTRPGSRTSPASSGAIRPRATPGCSSRAPSSRASARCRRCIRASPAGRRAPRGACRRRAGRPRRSHVLRHRSRRRRDARAGRRVRRGRHAARARRPASRMGASGTRTTARPSCRPPPYGRSSGATPGSACSSPTPTGRSWRRCISARRPRRRPGSGGTSAGSGDRPEDHLQTLLGTVGAARFVLGTGQPLRIPENAGAKLDLLDLSAGRPGRHRERERSRARRPMMALDPDGSLDHVPTTARRRRGEPLSSLVQRLEWGLIPAVPVPFRGDTHRRGRAADLRGAG